MNFKLFCEDFGGVEGAVGEVVDGDDYLARDGTGDGDALKGVITGTDHFTVGFGHFSRAHIIAVGQAIDAESVGGAIVVDEICAGIDALFKEPCECGVVAAGFIAECADGCDVADDVVVGHISHGEAAFIVRSRGVNEDCLCRQYESATATGGVARGLGGV